MRQPVAAQQHKCSSSTSKVFIVFQFCSCGPICRFSVAVWIQISNQRKQKNKNFGFSASGKVTERGAVARSGTSWNVDAPLPRCVFAFFLRRWWILSTSSKNSLAAVWPQEVAIVGPCLVCATLRLCVLKSIQGLNFTEVPAKHNHSEFTAKTE